MAGSAVGDRLAAMAPPGGQRGAANRKWLWWHSPPQPTGAFLHRKEAPSTAQSNLMPPKRVSLATGSGRNLLSKSLILIAVIALPLLLQSPTTLSWAHRQPEVAEEEVTSSTHLSSALIGDSTVTLQTDDPINDTNQAASNGTFADPQMPTMVMIINVIISLLIAVVGLCGNLVVILVIIRFTRSETVTDIYILNLAFADLFYLVGSVFLSLTMIKGNWIFGSFMCKIYMASTSVNQFASSLLLVVMSFDRFLAVCHPIYAQRFRQLARAKFICWCIWMICLSLMTPILIFAATSIKEGQSTCAVIWPEDPNTNAKFDGNAIYTIYSFIIGFAVPLTLIAAFYICVIRKLRLAATGRISLGSSSSSRRAKSRESTNRRIENLVIGIICTYTICWVPYWVNQLIIVFTPSQDHESQPNSVTEHFYHAVLAAQCLCYANSAINPILYAFLSDNFKRRCSDIVGSICSIGQRSPATGLSGLAGITTACLSEPNSTRAPCSTAVTPISNAAHLGSSGASGGAGKFPVPTSKVAQDGGHAFYLDYRRPPSETNQQQQQHLLHHYHHLQHQQGRAEESDANKDSV